MTAVAPFPRIIAWTSLITAVFVTAGCGSSEPKPDPSAAESVEARAEPETPDRQELPVFVVVERTVKLRLSPEEDAEYVQFRTPEQQRAVDEKRAEEAAERAERQAEAEEKFREREKKRAKRLRKRYRKRSWKRRKAMREREKERKERLEQKRADDRLESLDDLARRYFGEAPHQRLIPLRLVGEENGWLEVESVPSTSAGAHCYHGALPGLSPVRLRFFIREQQAKDVIVRKVRVPVRKGTEVWLASGVVVEENGDGWRAIVDGFVLDLDVPKDAIGKHYRVSERFEAPVTDTVFNSRAFIEEDLNLDRKQSLPYNPYATLHVTATLWVGNRFYASTQTRCGEYTVRTNEEALQPLQGRSAQRFGVGGEEVVEPYARPGAEIYSPDGRQIGETVAKYSLQKSVGDRDGRRCFRQRVWDENATAKPFLELCFDPDDVQKVDMNVWGD